VGDNSLQVQVAKQAVKESGMLYSYCWTTLANPEGMASPGARLLIKSKKALRLGVFVRDNSLGLSNDNSELVVQRKVTTIPLLLPGS